MRAIIGNDGMKSRKQKCVKILRHAPYCGLWKYLLLEWINLWVYQAMKYKVYAEPEHWVWAI